MADGLRDLTNAYFPRNISTPPITRKIREEQRREWGTPGRSVLEELVAPRLTKLEQDKQAFLVQERELLVKNMVEQAIASVCALCAQTYVSTAGKQEVVTNCINIAAGHSVQAWGSSSPHYVKHMSRLEKEKAAAHKAAQREAEVHAIVTSIMQSVCKANNDYASVRLKSRAPASPEYLLHRSRLERERDASRVRAKSSNERQQSKADAASRHAALWAESAGLGAGAARQTSLQREQAAWKEAAATASGNQPAPAVSTTGRN